ncbi:MAG TPA: hypothetical protein VJ183_05215 [Chloroflexia bacterium]|nr:hypothetical protein [Chloroflexia bacterium]
MATLAADLYDRDNEELVATVSFRNDHWTEGSARSVLNLFFTYGGLAPDASLDTQLKDSRNVIPLTELGRGRNATLSIIVRRRTESSPQGQHATSVQLQQLQECVRVVHETLSRLIKQGVNGTDPEAFRKAIEVLGARIDQRDDWLNEVRLALGLAGRGGANPASYGADVLAVHKELTDDKAKLESALAMAELEAQQEKDRADLLRESNDTLRGEKSRLNAEIQRLREEIDRRDAGARRNGTGIYPSATVDSNPWGPSEGSL